MTDTFRALCAELLDALEGYIEYAPVIDVVVEDEQQLVANARAALAQPEPQGPSDEDLIQLAIDTRLYRFQATAGDPIQYEMTEQQIHAFARAVLARFGRPTIEPVAVAERLPGPEDCFSDQHGQRSYKCWAQQYHQDNDGQPLRTVLEAWDLVDYRLLARCRRWYYAWLPHYALPVPQQQISGAVQWQGGITPEGDNTTQDRRTKP
jgi:hypothetical protein